MKPGPSTDKEGPASPSVSDSVGAVSRLLIVGFTATPRADLQIQVKLCSSLRCSSDRTRSAP
jgi:hypothetical protein